MVSLRGKCERLGNTLKLPSPTKLARLGHYPPSSQASWSAPMTPLQRQNAENWNFETENLKQIFPEKEYWGISPNFHIHVSVNDLYSPRIGPHISSSRKGRPIVGIYNSPTDTWMWKLGLIPQYSFSGNIFFKFSVSKFQFSAFCLCSGVIGALQSNRNICYSPHPAAPHLLLSVLYHKIPPPMVLRPAATSLAGLHGVLGQKSKYVGQWAWISFSPSWTRKEIVLSSSIV